MTGPQAFGDIGAAAHVPNLLSGAARIGKYRIESELGRGAFTRVYRGHDPTVGRPVAIKVLLDETRPDLSARFRQQAAAAANLQHKNIVAIYELGEHAGAPFVAMEHLEGVLLRQVLAQSKRLTLLQKMLIMSQVADALQCAHQSGAVDLDLKPSNILLLPDGVIKLMDFSIGQPAHKLDAIFAYGAIYHELLTRDECPEGLGPVIRRALERDRELRYQAIEDLQFDVAPVLEEVKRQRAEVLLDHALSMEDCEAARGLLREALELDPGNREARRLLERIREQQQRETIRKRIEELRDLAEQAIHARRFQDAVASLEAAQRLDANDKQVKARLEQSRAALDRSRKAAELLELARRQIQRQELEEARDTIQRAIETDPQDEDASRLLQRVEKEIAERERQRKIAQERQRRLAAGLESAREMVEAQRFAEAMERLESLSLEFAGEAEVRLMLADVRERLQRWQQALAAFCEVMDQGRHLLAQGRPDLAIPVLEQGLTLFPEQAQEVDSLLATARAALPEWERRRFVQETMARMAALEQRQQWHTAVTLLEEALARYPGSSELEAAAERVRLRSDHSERQQRLARRIVLIEQKIAEQAWSLALRLIESGRADFPAELVWQQLAGQVQNAQQRSECEALITRIQQAMAEADVDAVREPLRKGLELYPRESRFQALWEEFERQKAYRNDVHSAEALIGKRQFEEAEKLLLELKARRPGDSNLDALLEAARLGCFHEHPSEPDVVEIFREPIRRCTPVISSPHVSGWRIRRIFVGTVAAIALAGVVSIWKLTPRKNAEAAAPSPPVVAPRTQPETLPVNPPEPGDAAAAPVLQVKGAVPAPPKPATPKTRFDPSLLESRASRPAASALAVDEPPAPTATLSQLPGAHIGRVLPATPVTPPAPRPESETAPAPRPERIRLGGNFQEPKLIKEVVPQMPPLARERAIYGVVKMELTVGKDGAVKNVAILSGHPFLAAAAKDAALRRRYWPALLNGDPTEVKIPVQMVFQPR